MANVQDEYDYFKFSAATGDRLSVSLATDGNLYTALTLHDGSGTPLVSTPCCYTARSMEYTFALPGTYFIRVGSADNSGTYDLTATLTPFVGSLTETEPNNSLAEAQNVSLSSSPMVVTGTMANVQDEYDYFKFSAATGDRLSVSLATDGNLYTALTLHDGSGTPLVSTPCCYTARSMEYTFALPGTYFIRVGSADNSGTYDLTSTLTP